VKILNKILTVLLLMLIFVSCENRDSQSNAKNNDQTESEKQSDSMEADVKTVQLEIKGMTCEIGCAKLIQSKLYKTDGVSFAEVHFADSSGVVSYDANRLSEKDLVRVVEQAGGGDLYTVSSIDLMTDHGSNEETQDSAD